VFINMPELKVKGLAYVRAIEACPVIADGSGSVVTARFATRSVDMIASVEIMGADGAIEVIEGTPNHPFWSLDRNDWVPLGELEEGEHLRGEAGVAFVLTHVIVNRSVPVYNIEVHGEHVYQVGELGFLVHNACPAPIEGAANPLTGLPRVGSALKTDPYHAFPNIIDNYAAGATSTTLRSGATLHQVAGSLNGVAGRFEWIIDKCQVTHRMFVPGGTINGLPIKP
jgi:Pretoxin HINT domain